MTGFTLPSQPSQIVMEGWGGKADLSADVRLAFDEEYFYVAVDVQDDMHCAQDGSDMWRGDSIQIAFSEEGRYGPDFCIAHAAGSARVSKYKNGGGSLAVESIEAHTSREDNVTRYELKLPWAALYARKLDQGRLTFALLVNDNDGGNRRGWLEWTSGIGRERDPARHGTLYLITKRDGWTAWIEGPKEARPGEASPFRLYLPNLNDGPETFRIESESAGLQLEVTVPEGSVCEIPFDLLMIDPGLYCIESEITDCQGIRKRAAATLTVTRSPDQLHEIFDAIAESFPEGGAVAGTMRRAAHTYGL